MPRSAQSERPNRPGSQEDLSELGGERKRARNASGSSRTFSVSLSGLDSLGGPWVGLSPFSGNEDQFYRWVGEPSLWARVALSGLDSRTRHRLSQHHNAMHAAV